MDIAIFSGAGIDFLARWLHLMAGVTWIGLLYYFNLVQMEYFKEAEDAHRSGAIRKLVPRALLWFRWGAMVTFLSGLFMLAYRGSGVSLDITLGAVMGTIMFLNVWLIIWPNQKIVIASATAVAAGGAADPAAPGAGAKATLASRTNVLFSLPMLFFMAASTHWSQGPVTSAGALELALPLLIIAALEANALFGKLSVLATIRGVIHSSVGLTLVLYVLVAMF